MPDKKTCCLCGKEFEGSGNNPYPLMSPAEECCDDCNSRYVLAAREIYFPEGYSDDYVIFNHTTTTEELMGLLRAINSIKKGYSWLTETLAAARRERGAATGSAGDHEKPE